MYILCQGTWGLETTFKNYCHKTELQVLWASWKNELHFSLLIIRGCWHSLFLKGRWAVICSCKLALSGKLLFLTEYWPVSTIIARTLYREDAHCIENFFRKYYKNLFLSFFLNDQEGSSLQHNVNWLYTGELKLCIKSYLW